MSYDELQQFIDEHKPCDCTREDFVFLLACYGVHFFDFLANKLDMSFDEGLAYTMSERKSPSQYN